MTSLSTIKEISENSTTTGITTPLDKRLLFTQVAKRKLKARKAVLTWLYQVSSAQVSDGLLQGPSDFITDIILFFELMFFIAMLDRM